MLVMSKFGVLWLIDLVDGETIKVLTVHGYGNSSSKSEDGVIYNLNNNITKAVVIEPVSSQYPCKIITGSIDGTVK
jgi:hypothetical protein